MTDPGRTIQILKTTRPNDSPAEHRQARGSRSVSTARPPSESESLPINRTSRCGNVTVNSLKYDAACSPACFQSRKAQSVGANGFGACVVIMPTTTVGPMSMILFRRGHDCGASLVVCAPGNAPTTTSPGFNGLPVPDLRSAAQRPILHRRGPRQSRNRTTRPCARAQDRQVDEPNSGPSSFFRRERPDHTDQRFFLCTEHHISYCILPNDCGRFFTLGSCPQSHPPGSS